MATTNIQNMNYDEMMELSKTTTDAEVLQQMLNKIRYSLFIEEMADYLNWNYYHKLQHYEREIENKLKEVK